MKKSWKSLVAVCMILMMSVAVTACGDDSTPAATDSAEPAATEAPATEETQAADEAEPAEEEETADEGTASAGMRLTGGESLVEGMKSVIDDKADDGSYYYTQDMSEDGTVVVYQQGGIDVPGEDVTEEEYAQNLASGLSETGANDDLRVKPANEYSENVTYPVYVASFTSGGNEDTREWWVFMAFTDSGVYLYGINTAETAEKSAADLADETFPNLRIG